MNKPVKNKSHSVAALLSRIAATSGTTYEYILLRYGQERLLWRMANSAECGKFILKGASLFLVWQGHFYRTTRDIDFLGSGSSDLDRMKRIFMSLCDQNTVENDGLVFDATSVRTSPLQDKQDYSGVRVNIRALLERARIDLQVDIGFGDTITPAPERMVFPPLLDGPGPEVMAYPKYTAMAEKFLAMASLGIDNSRMKDFYDMVVMFRLMDFDSAMLARAIQNTCKARNFELTRAVPIALTEAFYENPAKINLWNGFSQRAGLTIPVGNLCDVVVELRKNLLPVLEIITRDKP
jgi:predicted nucleotidyltransferase component of viral defense system